MQRHSRQNKSDVKGIKAFPAQKEMNEYNLICFLPSKKRKKKSLKLNETKSLHYRIKSPNNLNASSEKIQ